MIEQSERTDDASVYAAKMKRKLEKVLVGESKNSACWNLRYCRRC
jgi:hypothetical protein